MMLVIDSNIMFSALIKDSVTRKIIMETKERLLLPYYFFEEYEIYREVIIKKARIPKKDIDIALDKMLSKIEIIPREKLLENAKEAFELVRDIDMNDTPFVACALAHPGSAIWSDDAHLKKLKGIKVLNTKEIL